MSQQINLFNPIFLKQKKQFSASTMVQALGLLLTGVIAFYGYASFGTADLVQQADETARQYRQTKERLARTSARYAPKKADARLEAEVNDLQSLVTARQTMLGGLGNDVRTGSTSYAEYMRALARQSVGGLWLTGFKLGRGGAELEILGRALQPELVPSYIRRLGQERAMHGRTFDSLGMAHRQAALPVDASRPAGAPTTYDYIEFRLGSIYGELPAAALAEVTGAPAAVLPQGGVAQGPAPSAQNPAGPPK
jgi:hypothetical protein